MAVLPRRVRRLLPLGAALAALLAAPTAPTGAQEWDPLARLDPASRASVQVIIDSARMAGLPTKPLINKALLGLSRHVDGRRIVGAVRQLHAKMREAHDILGPTVSDADLDAAASVLQAGVPSAVLTQFRPTRAGSAVKPIAVPLVVLADLITRGVPIDTASTAIMQMWQRGAAEADFYGLWRGVEQDILSGQNPGTALQQRVREYPSRPLSGQVPPPEREPESPTP